MTYHYADSQNKPVGPFTEVELQELYRRGAIKEKTYVFKEGESNWRPFDSLGFLPLPLAVAPRGTASQPLTLRTNPAQQLTVTAQTTRCPFCAEEIIAAAKKCKHCGEFLDPVLRAQQEAATQARTAQPVININNHNNSSATVTHPHAMLVANPKSGLVAALLNLLIPGVGYMYCGRPILGIFVMFWAFALLVGTHGIAAIIVYPVVFIDGFLAAGRANRRRVIVV